MRLIGEALRGDPDRQTAPEDAHVSIGRSKPRRWSPAPHHRPGGAAQPAEPHYGVADLLVALGPARRARPGTLDAATAPSRRASAKPCSYRVVDIKFRTLDLAPDRAAEPHDTAPTWPGSGSTARRWGGVQGYRPPSPTCSGAAEVGHARGTSCFERLARVDTSDRPTGGPGQTVRGDGRPGDRLDRLMRARRRAWQVLRACG